MSEATGALTPGQRIKAARIRLALTQDDVAQRAGVSLSTVQSIERDRRVRRKSLRLVAEVVGLDIETLDLPPTSPARLSDEDMIKEVRRRFGRQGAEFLQGLMAAQRKSETASPVSRSDNVTLSETSES
jgi:transcriptional regulator with XRE-family HTH domain